MRTFGIEIEAFGLPLAQVAQVITAAGIPCAAQHYNHTTSRTWKVVTDGSIRGHNGFEVVSPILTGEEGLEQVRKVMDALKAAGAQVNKSCGLHVHVGAAGFSVHEFRAIAKNYVIFEDFFDAIMPASRRASANTYIKSNRAIFGGYGHDAAARACAALSECRTVDEIINALTLPERYGDHGRDRYFKLNLTAYWRHQTIEFRQHSGTVDAEKAINWIKLLTHFVDRAAASRPRPRRPDAAPSASQVFSDFFRCFKVGKVSGLRAYFIARRRALHGSTEA